MNKCPCCGRLFEDSEIKLGLTPQHANPDELLPRASWCPGSGQYPRNTESDQRPLWKDINHMNYPRS